jgi:hypothetical protein
MLKSKRTNYKKPRKEPINQKKTFFTKENLFISRMASILMVPKPMIMGIFSSRAVTTIRLNPLKGNVEATKKHRNVLSCSKLTTYSCLFK